LVLTVVIDTNIYISAIFWNGKPREVIDLGREGRIIYDSLSQKALKSHLSAGDGVEDFRTWN
jgi:predicted nucleic acid-binding protein